MDAVKAVLLLCKFVKWNNGVTVNFGKLTYSAGSYPNSDFLLNAILHKAWHNELFIRFNYCMWQSMNSFKIKMV